MDEEGWKRLRGLKRLIHDGVRHGTDFVEKHHRHAARKPFNLLESVKLVAGPTKVVRSVHDGVLSLTYGSIRAIHHATEVVDDWATRSLAAGSKSDLGSNPKSG